MRVDIPSQTLSAPVKNPIEGLSGCGVRIEFHSSRQPWRRNAVVLAEKQVAITPQDPYVIRVLMEWVLPMPLSDYAQEHEITRMHVRVAVVRLIWVIRSVVGIHVVRHGAAVDQEVRGVIRLYRDSESGRARQRGSGIGRSAIGDGLYLLFRLTVNAWIQLGPLEQILTVITCLRMIVGSGCKAEIGCPSAQLLRIVLSHCRAIAGHSRRQNHHCSVKTHLNL